MEEISTQECRKRPVSQPKECKRVNLTKIKAETAKPDCVSVLCNMRDPNYHPSKWFLLITVSDKLYKTRNQFLM